MVAPKRGRGAKGQAPKTRAAAQSAEEQPMDQTEPVEQLEETTEGNGDAEEQQELSEETLLAGEEENQTEGGEAEEARAEGAETAEAAQQIQIKEEKVESGKILVENLPSTYLFDYQEKLKELFSKHGEVISVKRGPIIVTEQTTTPTLSAIVEFKNKDYLDKALTEKGTVLDGRSISVAVESRSDTAVLVGVPYEACTEYVRQLFLQCGEIQQIQEFSKAKYKILRVTFQAKEAVEKALKLDRELRINGFLVTVSKYRDEEEQKAHSANIIKHKRQHSGGNQNRNNNAPAANVTANSPHANRGNSYRGRGGGGGGGGVVAGGGAGGGGGGYNARGNYRGSRGRGGYAARGGGSFPRGGYANLSSYMPPQPYMGGRPGGFMNDGQRPNKRLRQM